ncbi:heterokaryon incompatibility protein-domain-containing protein [Podospora australis]|uniref:Heterokaryon incompatibility protein-domain-containing protein n=1 Tax=Podospora australis TaxID=1536484 RepID=A0AAN6WZC2_9PEZI|nr:heterokaryon incompatibility protein-domain-containing protein [Podospora australis]
MRLLNAKNLTFFEFVAEETRPRYAILSHTWEQDEATFQDMLALSPSLHSKAGYKKIVKCCQVAVDDGFEWVWIDTCCIDKTNHAELSESINSMYRWYQNSAVCYVYLWDLLDTDSEWRWKASLKNRKWFTRGWTLQELIAPRNVDFFDSTWERKGNKHDILTELCEATGIFKEVLSGHVLPKSCCVAERMSWASKRITTRTEDIAYCLLGIFGVHMPMIYGEHKNAFRRLQEEIIRDQNDLSIFAWVAMRYSSEPRRFGYPLLAESPTDFMRGQHWLCQCRAFSATA